MVDHRVNIYLNLYNTAKEFSYSDQQYMRVPVCPHPCQSLVCLFIFTFAILVTWQFFFSLQWKLCVLCRFSHVGPFVTLQTVACQAPLSTGSSPQEYSSGLPCLSLGVFPSQGLNPCLLHLLCGQAESVTSATMRDCSALHLCPTTKGTNKVN